MAKKKSSNAGGGLLVLVAGAVALIAAIPREVWVGAGVLAAICIAVYLYAKSKNSQSGRRNSYAVAPDSRPVVTSAPAQRRMSAQTVARFADADEPVSTGASQGQRAAFRIPSAPKEFGAASWVPSGQTVSVGGVVIPGGMVYLGTNLPTPLGANDPCLIDPSKSAGRFSERGLGLHAPAQRLYG